MLCGLILAGVKKLSFNAASARKGGAHAKSRRGGEGILCVYQAAATMTFARTPPFSGVCFLISTGLSRKLFHILQLNSFGFKLAQAVIERAARHAEIASRPGLVSIVLNKRFYDTACFRTAQIKRRSY